MAALVSCPLGCSAPDATQSGDRALPGSGGAQAGQDAAGPAGTGGSGGQPPGEDLTTYEATIGPMSLAAGAEDTRCIVTRLGNSDGALVRRFRTTLHEGAHHFILYRSDQTVEDPVPKPCKGFSGFLGGEHPIFIAQHAKTELVFPTDGGKPVGLEVAPNQMVRLEMHTLNASAAPIDVSGTVALDTRPLEDEAVRSDIAFWGTTHLDAGGDPPSDAIPPNSVGDTGVMFQPALGGTKLFALTTHQHWLATRMRVWLASGPDALEQLVADTGNWSDPPVEIFDPALVFPKDGQQGMSSVGLAYRCEWNNTTPNPVPFGESAVHAEMCFLWHFYYPAGGFHYCIDGECS